MINSRGVVHIATIVMVFIIGIILQYIFQLPKTPTHVDKKGNDTPSQIENSTSSGRKHNKALDNVERIMFTAIDQQNKLLKIKAHLILLALESVDDNTRNSLIDGFANDMLKEQPIVKRLVEEFNTNKWDEYELDERRGQIDGLLKTLVSQEDSILTSIQEIRKSREKTDHLTLPTFKMGGFSGNGN